MWEDFSAYDFDWAPDGSRIAYTFGAQVYIRDLLGQSVYRIESSERSHHPRWSCTGDTIAFFVRIGDEAGLYLYNNSSGSLKFVRFGYTFGDWLPGCGSLAVLSYRDSADGELCTYALESKEEAILPYVNRFKRAVAVSPDGRSIMIGRDGYGAYTNVWSFDRVSLTYSQVTTEGGDYPAWSPDGEWIVFTKIDPDNGHLWLMRPDGSEKHQITF